MSAIRQFLDTGILSLDPLVTYTKRHPPTPIGVAGALPELFANRPSFHLVSSSWYMHDWAVAEIASEFRRISAVLPDARFLFLATSEYDAYRLSQAGVPNFVCNSLIFVDEQTFRPLAPYDGTGARYDAIYNARLEPYKRHELAVNVKNLALIYDSFDGSSSNCEPQIRQWLPTAHFLNHRYGGGNYKKLGKAEIAVEINRARCGLCLSAQEGEMRASVEYLLCGAPIVSTESIGDRDRYFQHPYVMIVPDEPQAIAKGVAEMARRNISKLAVRDHVGRLIECERRAFLKGFNTIARDHFGSWDDFTTVKAFMDVSPFTRPAEAWSRHRLEPVAEALGISLPVQIAEHSKAPAAWSSEANYRELFLKELALSGIPDEYNPGEPAANHSFLYLLARTLRELPINNVLELGAGQTSILIDRIRMTKIPTFEATTFEHDGAWAQRIGAAVKHPVVLTQLRLQTVAGLRIESYEFPEASPNFLDVLVIDGPPAFDVAHKFARLGALNLISRLGQDFVVIVDDTERAGEAMLSAMIQDQLSTLNIGFRRKDIRGAQCQTIFAGGAFAGAADF